ncbi:MAG: hypothetical protein F2842_05430 [Actinobacteria bacterium]|uniref:Unannotated protein n=1 Tax=freshwater metagenome TaxID=449393 RepID=A0A6J7JM93_9ZZZZ|nr:hypothetical protein [Actinomycetota bacterium]
MASTATHDRRVTATDLSAAFNGNTGNAIFEEALLSRLPHADHLYDPTPQSFAQYDHVVLSLANIISAHPLSESLTHLADTLAEARRINPSLRYVVTAIGAQHYSLENRAAVHPERLALVRQLAESAEFLGVRGFYTAELLADHGITNTWVVGDPALLHPRIGADQPELPVPDDGDIVVHWTSSGRYRDTYRGFLDWARRHRAHLVAQSTLERLLPGDKPYSVAASPDLAACLQYYSWPGRPHDELEAWMVERGLWFGAADDWYRFLRGKRLVLGARFHGNAAAVIAGVPALQLTLDSRTAELSSFHGLPSMPLHHFDPRRGADEYLELADLGTLYARLPLLRANLQAFWAAVGLNAMPEDNSGAAVAAPGCVSGSEPLLASAWQRGLGLRDRYLRRAILHADALDHDPMRPAARDRSVLESIALPRSDAEGQLIDAAPGIVHALRATSSNERAQEVAQWLGATD